MNDSTVRRVAGGAGLVAAILTLVEVPLHFVYSGPPPDANVLTRSLFGLIGSPRSTWRSCPRSTSATTPPNFYAANGWGATATMGALFMLWLLATAIATIRATTDTTVSAPAPSREVLAR